MGFTIGSLFTIKNWQSRFSKTRQPQAENGQNLDRTKTQLPPDEQSQSGPDRVSENNRNSGPPGMAQHSSEEIQQSPAAVQHPPKKVEQSPAAVQHPPKKVEQSPTAIQRSPTAIQHFPKGAQPSPATVQRSSAATAQHPPKEVQLPPATVQRSPAPTAVQHPPKDAQPSPATVQPPATVQRSSATVQHPPKEVQTILTAVQRPQTTVQQPPKEVQPSTQQLPTAVQHLPEQPPAAPPHSSEEVNDSLADPSTQLTRKHKGRLDDDRDRQIINLKRELVESIKITDEHSRAAKSHWEQCQQLKEILNQRDLNITELTETILRTVRSGATTTRDDDYFEGEFARLANAIHQWVFRYFNPVSDINHGALPNKVKECLERTVFEYATLRDHKVKRKDIEAAVSERIYNFIFRKPFLFGKHGTSYNGVRPIVGGTDLEKRNWEVQTLELAMKTNNYHEQLREATFSFAQELFHEFEALAKEGSREYRHKSLCAILEQAVKLCTETARQVSQIRLPKIVPGSEYNPGTMEDRSSAADEDDDEEEGGAQGFSVQMVLVPPVNRLGFDEAGKFLKPILIRKGTVIAVRLDGEQDVAL